MPPLDHVVIAGGGDQPGAVEGGQVPVVADGGLGVRVPLPQVGRPDRPEGTAAQVEQRAEIVGRAKFADGHIAAAGARSHQPSFSITSSDTE